MKSPPKKCATGYHREIINLVHQSLQQNEIDHIFLPSLHYEVPSLAPCDINKNTVYVLSSIDLVLPEKVAYWIQATREILDNPVLVLTSVLGVEKDFPELPKNFYYIHIGGDFLFQKDRIPKIQPVTVKKNTDRFWLSISNQPRLHRVLTAFCLLGNNLGLDQGYQPQTGLLRIAPSFTTGEMTTDNWPAIYNLNSINCWTECLRQPHNLNQTQQNIMQKGFEALKEIKNGGQPNSMQYQDINNNPYDPCYPGPDNAKNFEVHLRGLYENALIELINETTFFNKAVFVTEKFLNSVYGYALPILFCNSGAVQYLRDHGFDMFDDIIDHSYDTITDPLQRIFAAVESNMKLLTDKDHARKAWHRAKTRMDVNYEFASQKIYDHFTDYVKSQLQEFIVQHKSCAPGRI